MMLFTFVKKDGNVERIGGESSVSEELGVIFKPFSEGGFEPATAEEYDAQVIGVLSKKIAQAVEVLGGVSEASA